MMKLIKVMSVVLIILVITSVGRAALIAHWTFDETSGPVLDSSGNGFHGSIVGTVIQGQAGKIGGAYLFSAAGWVDFGVDTVTTQVTDFPICISYWIKSTAVTGTRCAVWMGRRGADTQYLQTGMKNGNANAGYRNTTFDDAAAWKDRGTTATEADGQWHHIVAVYPDATERHVYVDGVLADSITFTQPYFTGTNQVAVGNNNRRSTLTDAFDGLIDDVQIWNEVLTDGQIAAIYAKGLGDVAANPRPLGNAVDPGATSTLEWDAPSHYTPEVGYNLVLRKATQTSEPNFAASDNIIDITDATAMSPFMIALDYDATYYWRVDSYEPNGVPNDATDDILHPGVVWSFSTLGSAPFITGHPVSVLADTGQTIEFQIAFESLSPAQLTWYKSTDEYNDTLEDDIQILMGSETLTIPSVGLSDEGFYYCVVSNASNIDVRSNVASLKLRRLLAWYQFEKNGLDSAGDNHGTEVGSMNYSAGIVTSDGQLFAADPNGANYFALTTESYPKTGFGNGLSQFTYACWVKMDNDEGGILLGSLNTGFNTGLRFSVNTGDGSISCFLRQNGSISRSINIHNLPIADGQWHHVVVTNDGSRLVAYFDGLAQGNTAFNLTNFAAWEFPLYIGAINSRGIDDQHFRGTMDDLRIYNYALSLEDVIQTYYEVTGQKVCIEKPSMDMNNDCVVDMTDLALLAASWLESGLRPIE
jgi:hypothetical protein